MNRAEVPTIVPNQWQGQTNCLVGPFSSRHEAKYFATWMVNSGDHEANAGAIFAKGDGWL